MSQKVVWAALLLGKTDYIKRGSTIDGETTKDIGEMLMQSREEWRKQLSTEDYQKVVLLPFQGAAKEATEPQFESASSIEWRCFRNMFDSLVEAYHAERTGCVLNEKSIRERHNHLARCTQSVVEWWIAGGREILDGANHNNR